MAKSGDIRVDVTVHLCMRDCGRSCTKHDYPSPRIRVQEFRCGVCGEVAYAITDINAKPVYRPEPEPSRPCVLPDGHRWDIQQGYYR